jgi:hypothetical protein
MRETKSTPSLRPIDISYRNDLKNVSTRANRAREKDCSLGSGLDCSGAKIRDYALQPSSFCRMIGLPCTIWIKGNTGCLLNTGSIVCRKLLIEVQVEFKHIDPRFAKNS